MSTAFKELSESPLETLDRTGLHATRKLLCAWGDRRELVRELIGEGAIYGGDGPKNYPGMDNVVPVRVRTEPFTDDVMPQVLSDLSDGLNAYDGFAKVTVDYEYVQIDWPGASEIELQEHTYLSVQSHGSAEAVLLKGSPLYWYNNNDPQAVTEDDLYFVRRVAVVEHVATWHFVRAINTDLVRQVVGTINATDLWGAAAETLLFDSYSVNREFVVLDDLSEPMTFYQVTYVFRERRVPAVELLPGVGGWNHCYRTLPTTQSGWDKLQSSAGDPIYPSSSNAQFNNLFKYGEAVN